MRFQFLLNHLLHSLHRIYTNDICVCHVLPFKLDAKNVINCRTEALQPCKIITKPFQLLKLAARCFSHGQTLERMSMKLRKSKSTAICAPNKMEWNWVEMNLLIASNNFCAHEYIDVICTDDVCEIVKVSKKFYVLHVYCILYVSGLQRATFGDHFSKNVDEDVDGISFDKFKMKLSLFIWSGGEGSFVYN